MCDLGVYKEWMKVQPWTASSVEELENIRKRASYDLRYAYAIRELSLEELALTICNGHSVQPYKGESRFVVLRLIDVDEVANKELPANVVIAGDYIIKEFDIEISTTEAYGLVAHEFRRELERFGISATTDIYFPNPEKPYLGCNGFAATLFGVLVSGDSKWCGLESDRFELSRTSIVLPDGTRGSSYACVSTLIDNPMPTSLTELIGKAPDNNSIRKYRDKNWTVCQSDTPKQVAYKLVGIGLLADAYGIGGFTERQFTSAIVEHEFARMARLSALKKEYGLVEIRGLNEAYLIFYQYYFNMVYGSDVPFYSAGRMSYSEYRAKHGQHLRCFRPRGGSNKRKLTVSKKAKTMKDKAKSAKCSRRTLYNHGMRSTRLTNIEQVLDSLNENGVLVYHGSLPNAKRKAILRYNKQHPDAPIVLVKVNG